jgi:hypothetical protein
VKFGSLKVLCCQVYSVLSVNSVSIVKTRMVNLIFLCEHTIRIPQLPCQFSMAKAVSSTIELVKSVTSDTVNLFNFAICAFASKCLAIELAHVLMDGAELDDK